MAVGGKGTSQVMGKLIKTSEHRWIYLQAGSGWNCGKLTLVSTFG